MKEVIPQQGTVLRSRNAGPKEKTVMSLRTTKRLLKCFLPAGRHIPQRVFAQVAGVLVLSLLAAGGASGGSTGQKASADNFNNVATIDTTSAHVQSKDQPISIYQR